MGPGGDLLAGLCTGDVGVANSVGTLWSVVHGCSVLLLVVVLLLSDMEQPSIRVTLRVMSGLIGTSGIQTHDLSIVK